MKIMTVKINQDSWEIRMLKPDKKKLNPHEGSMFLGLTEYQKGIISLRKGLSRSETRATIIHELSHAFLFSFGYRVDDEESMCNFWGAQGDAICSMADKIMEKVGLCYQRMK